MSSSATTTGNLPQFRRPYIAVDGEAGGFILRNAFYVFIYLCTNLSKSLQGMWEDYSSVRLAIYNLYWKDKLEEVCGLAPEEEQCQKTEGEEQA
jgi:hypothetical protein